MRRLRRSALVRCFVLPLALTLWLGACHKWVPVQPPVPALSEQASRPAHERNRVRLHLGSGATVEGTVTELAADTLVLGAGGANSRFGLDEVVRVELRRTDVAASIGLGVGITALAFGLLIGTLALICASSGCFHGS